MSNSADNINYLILSYAVYLKFFFLFFFSFLNFTGQIIDFVII